ncbi:DUF2974 domain-containing protein [Sodalis glossinidius]|nr:DUF2974 domain-containing protein [Sodalis glossinidius]
MLRRIFTPGYVPASLTNYQAGGNRAPFAAAERLKTAARASITAADGGAVVQRVMPATSIQGQGGGDYITCGILPQQGDYHLAQVAGDVYAKHSALPPGAFRRFTTDELRRYGFDKRMLRDPSSGFQANFYDNGRQVALAFAGTNDFNDWLTNLRASLGLRDAQYRASVALARQAKRRFGDKVLFTGHSLGGSLAAIAAVATGSLAVTFNPAGVAEKTFSRYGASPVRARWRSGNGSIRCYSGQYDPLYCVQRLLPLLPRVPGHRILLRPPEDAAGNVPLLQTMVSIWRSHGIKNVIAAMARAVKSAAYG